MALIESGAPANLVAVHLRLPASNQSGRAFLPASLLTHVKIDDLASALGSRFVEEDDVARLSLLRDELAAHTVTVETFPSEHTPVAHYAYVRAINRPGESLFACVLAPTAVLEDLVQSPPHVVLETATFQAIGDDASTVALKAGLESWLHRVFPEHATPAFRLVQWPDIEAKSASLKLPRLPLSQKAIVGAPSQVGRSPIPIPLQGATS